MADETPTTTPAATTEAPRPPRGGPRGGPGGGGKGRGPGRGSRGPRAEAAPAMEGAMVDGVFVPTTGNELVEKTVFINRSQQAVQVKARAIEKRNGLEEN